MLRVATLPFMLHFWGSSLNDIPFQKSGIEDFMPNVLKPECKKLVDGGKGVKIIKKLRDVINR